MNKKVKFIMIPAVLLILLGIVNLTIESKLDSDLDKMRTHTLFQETNNTASFTRRFSSDTVSNPFISLKRKPKITALAKGITGSVTMEISDSDGQVLLRRKGREFNLDESLEFSEGICNIRLVFHNFLGVFRYGTNGTIAYEEIPANNKYQLIAADVQQGFHWDYLLYVPADIKINELLVIPNNTGSIDDRMEVHKMAALDDMRGFENLADNLGTALLIPVFPRPASPIHGKVPYTHNLDREVLFLEEKYERLDLQLLAMVDHARDMMSWQGVEINSSFLMYGFSAAGTFTDRFSFLHPDRLIAVAAGGCDHMLPLAELKRENLPYPLGIYQFEEIAGYSFNKEAFFRLPRFLFKGENETGGTYTLKDGTVLPAEEYYNTYILPDLEQADLKEEYPVYHQGKADHNDLGLIKYRVFDGTILARQHQKISELFSQHGWTASDFRLYPDTAHNTNRRIDRDVEEFFKEALSQNKTYD